MLYLKTTGKELAHWITMPFIYSCIIPIVILDIWMEIYHRICFPLYDLPYIDRSKYIKIDRHKLSYLDTFQKVDCAYCGYANGAIRYWGQIAAATEAYWCGIKHAEDDHFEAPAHHADFAPYNDQKAFTEKYQEKNPTNPDASPVPVEQTEDVN